MTRSDPTPATPLPDAQGEWFERVRAVIAGNFVRLATVDGALAVELQTLLERIVAEAEDCWAVRRPDGETSVLVALPDALRVGVGENWLTCRWDGSRPHAVQLVENAAWQLADQWPKRSRTERP